jgi:hypothetical protein
MTLGANHLAKNIAVQSCPRSQVQNLAPFNGFRIDSPATIVPIMRTKKPLYLACCRLTVHLEQTAKTDH